MKPLNLKLTKRYDDWHCCEEGHPKAWDCGKTPIEAIGQWVLTHGGEHGIKTNFPNWPKKQMAP
jgi:hypothetical protein